MKTLVLVNIFDNDEGAELFLKTLASKFVEDRNFTVKFLSRSHYELDPRIERVPIRTIGRRASWSLLRQTLHCIKDIRLAVRNGNSIVVLNGERAMYLAPFLPRSNAYVGIKHMSIEGKHPVFKRVAFLLALLFSKYVVTISDYHKRILGKGLPDFLARKIRVIYLGIDCHNKFIPPSALRNDVFTFVIAGSLIRRKGHMDLLESFSNIVDKAYCRLDIVGSGELLEDIRTYVRVHSLDDFVNIHGFQENTEKFFKLCHAFVLPSYSEGMPLSILEALACELPVISTNVVAIPEVITPGLNGFLIDPGDKNQLSEHMLYLVQNPDIAAEMGAAGRQIVLSRFSIERMMAGYERLFEGFL